MPLELTVNITGNRTSDLEDAIAEVKRLVDEGYLSGHDSNDTGEYQFDISGTEVRTHFKDESGGALCGNPMTDEADHKLTEDIEDADCEECIRLHQEDVDDEDGDTSDADEQAEDFLVTKEYGL
jgi:hypothetical protein